MFVHMQILTDWHLIGLILLITAGMVAILVIGSAIPQTRLKLSLESDRENSNKFDVSTCIMIKNLKCFIQSY